MANSQTSRRMFLRGVGVTMALPWLESVPVWGAAADAAGAGGPFPKRFAVVFMGNGINGNHWWSKGQGDEMKTFHVWIVPAHTTEARAARYLTRQNTMTGPIRAGPPGAGRSEHRNHRNSKRRSDVHRPGIIRDHGGRG